MERSAVKFGMPKRRAVWQVSDDSYRLLLPLAFAKMVWFIWYNIFFNPALMEHSAVKFGMPNCREVW